MIPSIRPRSELEEGDPESSTASPSSPPPLSYLHPSAGIARNSLSVTEYRSEADPDFLRASKRQRIGSQSSSASFYPRTILSEDIHPSTFIPATMKPTESDQESGKSVQVDAAPEAGPSSSAGSTNGYNGAAPKHNGYSNSYTNGTSRTTLADATRGGRAEKQATSITRVSLPGSTLYDDSYVDREEFVRLTIQSLRDVGYM